LRAGLKVNVEFLLVVVVKAQKSSAFFGELVESTNEALWVRLKREMHRNAGRVVVEGETIVGFGNSVLFFVF